MRSSFNQLLVALSVIDSLYVITGIVDYSLVKVDFLKMILIITINTSVANDSLVHDFPSNSPALIDIDAI